MSNMSRGVLCDNNDLRLRLGLLVKSRGNGSCCRLVDNAEDLKAGNSNSPGVFGHLMLNFEEVQL